MPRRLPAQQSHIPVVVIAGGAGFLGSHLCESLLQSGAQVIAIDDLITGSSRNLSQINHHPNFEFIEGNINQGIPKGLEDRKITHVIQAAGVETHGESQEATLAMTLTGAFGTKSMLDLAVSTGAHFLLVSSINVYEGLASSTQLDNYFGSTTAQEARFSQQEAKRYAEGLCELYAKEYNLDVRVARLSQLYGPRMDVRTPELLSRLIKATITGKNLEVDADSNATLLLTYVTDAVYGISRLLFAEETKFKGSIYAFANPEKVSVLSVAYTLRELAGSGREVTFLPNDRQPVFNLPKIAIERVKQDLDWEPAVKVTDGLKQTVVFFKEQMPPLEDHVVSAAHLQTNLSGVQVDGSAGLLPAKRDESDGSSTGLRFRGGVSSGEQPQAKMASTAVLTTATKAKSKAIKTGAQLLAKKRTLKGPWWRRLLFGSAAILLYLSVGRPATHTVVFSAAGIIDAQRGLSDAKSLHFDKAGRQFELAGRQLRLAGQSASGVGWLAGLIGQKEALSQAQQGLFGAGVMAEAVSTASQAADPLLEEMQQLARFERPSSDGHFSLVMSDAQKTIAQAKSQLIKAREVVSRPGSEKVAGASFKNGHDSSGGWVGGLLEQVRKWIVQAEYGLASAEDILKIAPAALGDGGPKTYLIMLENSNELRPTGGFLGSYAYLKLRDGRIDTFEIDDIYNPNNKLPHSGIAAPEAFDKAFGVKELQLIDSNWSPDATTSGKQVAALYTSATGKEVDGVVFMTTEAVRLVMSAMGPMKLNGYKETVTADNFDQLAQVYSDVGFTPGSTGKKDFLGEMADTLLSKLKEQQSSGGLAVAKAVNAGLVSKEIQMWTADTAVLSALDTQGWSGKIKEAKGDYLRVVEANMSANKANYYVERRTDYAINVDRDSQLHGVATITWAHTGTNATWPGGDYRTYVRVYVPNGAVLTGWNGFDEDGVVEGEEGNKKVYGGFVKIPYNTTRSVELRYDLPESIGLPETNGGYTLLWQKQAGIIDEPVTVKFNAPIFLTAKSVSGQAKVASDGSIVWQNTGSGDLDWSANLQKKNGTWSQATD